MKAKVAPGLGKKFKKTDQGIEDRVKKELRGIASYAVTISPVYSGAYVTSFSMKPNYSSGRGRTSTNKPEAIDKQAKKQEGRSQLYSDIENLDLEKDKMVVLSNGAPHVNKVEYEHGYAVFTKVKSKFR